MYFSMFDEYDEGTALLSAATDYTMLPTDAYFLTTSADGRWLSSDFYLRLAGDAARMLKGVKDTALTTPHSLGPVFYRNSFESRTTPYNYVNNVPQNTGTFPIDPCFYQPQEILRSGVTDARCAIVRSSARMGDYALSVSGTAAGNAVYQYRFAKTAKLDPKDLHLIIDKIYVYEDHVEIRLKADIDSILRCGSLPVEAKEPEILEKSAETFNSGTKDSLNVTIVQETEKRPDKVFRANVICDGDTLRIRSILMQKA